MVGNIQSLATSYSSLLLFLAWTTIRCEDEKPPGYVTMSFEIPIQIKINKQQSDKIGLADTIWLHGMFTDSLTEYYTRNKYRFENFDFKTKLCFYKLGDPDLYITEQQEGPPHFEIINYLGEIRNVGSYCGDFKIHYQYDNYQYKIALIPKSSGIFSLNFLWPVDIHGIPEEQINLKEIISLAPSPDGRKQIPVYEAFYFIVNDGKTNFDLFKNSCRAASLENPIPRNIFYEQKGSFTFRVE